MGPRVFWVSLQESGRVAVPPPVPLPPQQQALEQREHEESMRDLDTAARMELPCEAPPLSLVTAAWAAARLYRACQFLVYREVDGQTVENELAVKCPEAASPEVCYSADLALRWLADLIALARGVSDEDPLSIGLLGLARRWPLSSVGVTEVGNVDVSCFIDQPALRRLYADRIIERTDQARLKDPRAADAVREALGGVGERLAPAIAAALARQEDNRQ